MKDTDAQLLARLAQAEDEGDEDLAEAIERELGLRTEDDAHPDSPSLGDEGRFPGSYAS